VIEVETEDVDEDGNVVVDDLVAVVDADGNVLATDEPCCSDPGGHCRRGRDRGPCSATTANCTPVEEDVTVVESDVED